MPKIKNSGLDQCGMEPFEHQQFETAGFEGVNRCPKEPISLQNRQHISGVVGHIIWVLFAIYSSFQR